MDSHQDVDSWLAEIAGRPSVFNHNPRLRSAEFRSFELVNQVTLAGANGATENVYLFARQTRGGEAVLRVAVSAHDDTRHALLALREGLDNSMNPDIPRAASRLAKLVDIGFALGAERGQRGVGLAAASFSVGNVSVTLNSVGESAVDVSAAATHIGKLLATPPDKTALKSGRARLFAPTDVELRAGQALTLIEQLPEARPGAERIQLLAPEGEFRRDGTALLYVARAKGPQRIELFTHAQPAD